MPKLNITPHRLAQLHALRGEGGSITVFALLMLVSMIGIGGMAVNTMYFETKRIELQDAADRCALMSAIAQNRIDGGATTDLTSAQVANDCLAKSSVGSAGMNAPDVQSQNSERSVTLSGNYGFSPVFPNIAGASNASMTVTSRANQKLPNIEITIVLDVMHTNFVTNIKEPLKQFLNTVSAPDTGRKVSVNIVPFTSNVHLGTDLAEMFSDQNKPGHSNTARRTCLTLPADLRNSLDIPTDRALNWSWPIVLSMPPASLTSETTYQLYSETLELSLITSGATSVEGGDCNAEQDFYGTSNHPLIGAQVARPISATSATPINQKIDGLRAPFSQHLSGSSESNSAYGLKWALAFMDSSTRSIFSQRIASGLSPSDVAGRPQDYMGEDVMKVVIFIPNNVFLLRANGNNREMRPEFITTDLAPIWRTSGAGSITQPVRYSIHHPDAPGPNQYWVTRGYMDIFAGPTGDAHWAATPFAYPGETAVQQTWQDVWNKMTMSYAIRQLYMAPMASVSAQYHWNAMINRFTYESTSSVQARADFTELCNKAKAQGVLIYSILGGGTANIGGSFSGAQQTSVALHNAAAPSARTLYQQCATSPAHAFTVNLTQPQMRSIFRLIASNIAQLTLKQ